MQFNDVDFFLGFYCGFIYWDDEDLGDRNYRSVILFDGYFGINIEVEYCCRLVVVLNSFLKYEKMDFFYNNIVLIKVEI